MLNKINELESNCWPNPFENFLFVHTTIPATRNPMPVMIARLPKLTRYLENGPACPKAITENRAKTNVKRNMILNFRFENAFS